MGMGRGGDKGGVLQGHIEGSWRHIPYHQGPIAFHTAKTYGEDIIDGTGTS